MINEKSHKEFSFEKAPIKVFGKVAYVQQNPWI
jgi:hypothetical protein